MNGLSPAEVVAAARVGQQIGNALDRLVATREQGPCQLGKVPYSSQREARKALTRLTRFRAVRGDDFLEDHEYRCPLCPSWHLTSKKRSGGKSRLR